jgi:hypothetical protein
MVFSLVEAVLIGKIYLNLRKDLVELDAMRELEPLRLQGSSLLKLQAVLEDCFFVFRSLSLTGVV